MLCSSDFMHLNTKINFLFANIVKKITLNG
jgi:hypothetical protein